MKTRTQLEKELKQKYGQYDPSLWTPEEKAEMEAIRLANREKTGGKVSVNLGESPKGQKEAPAEIVELFPSRTKKGLPKRNVRAGFFVLGESGDVLYFEPQNDVSEYHGNIFKDSYLTASGLLEFFAEFED